MNFNCEKQLSNKNHIVIVCQQGTQKKTSKSQDVQNKRVTQMKGKMPNRKRKRISPTKKKSMLLKLTHTRIKKKSKDQLITRIQIAVGAHGHSNSSSGFKYLVNYNMLHMSYSESDHIESNSSLVNSNIIRTNLITSVVQKKKKNWSQVFESILEQSFSANTTHFLYATVVYYLEFLFLASFFFKLGIRFQDRLIRGCQSHHPLAGGPFKARAKLRMDQPAKIDTGRIRT